MTALVMNCPHCKWERLAMSPKHDAKALREHAKLHEGKT